MKFSALVVAGIASLATAAPISLMIVRHGPAPVASSGNLMPFIHRIRFHFMSTPTTNVVDHIPSFVHPVRNDRPQGLYNHLPTVPQPQHVGCIHLREFRERFMAIRDRLRALVLAKRPPPGQPTMVSSLHTGPAPVFRPTLIRIFRMGTAPLTGHHDGFDAPFLARLQQSMLNLGTWEGRAVAFVLGCGMGVLLRMIFVFGLLLWRARTRRAAAATNVIRLEGEETETLLPPRYSAEEKGELVLATPPGYLVEEKEVSKEEE